MVVVDEVVQNAELNIILYALISLFCFVLFVRLFNEQIGEVETQENAILFVKTLWLKKNYCDKHSEVCTSYRRQR
jgi:hypothetical protein